MLRRMFLIALMILGTAAVPSAYAEVVVESQQLTQNEIELTRSVIYLERQAIIADTMGLNDEEARAFWPVYRSYWAERTPLRDELIKLVMEYAERYKNDNITDEFSGSMLEQYLNLRKAEIELKQQYVSRFNDILPAKKVALYFQSENKLDAIVDYELVANIPLVR